MIQVDVINKILSFVQPLVKVALKLVLMPLTKVIELALVGLNVLIDGLEEAITAYERVVAAAKAKVSGEIANALLKVEAKQTALSRKDIELENIARAIKPYADLCDQPCKRKLNVWRFEVTYSPAGCESRAFARKDACVKEFEMRARQTASHVARQMAMKALSLVKYLIKGAMYVIFALLEVPKLLMLGASEALKMSGRLVALAIKPFGMIDQFKPCIGCITLDFACFWAAFDAMTVLRIHDFAVAADFSMSKPSFDMHAGITVFGKAIQLDLQLSLSLSGFVDFFKDFVVAQLQELLGAILDALTCDTKVVAGQANTATLDAEQGKTTDAETEIIEHAKRVAAEEASHPTPPPPKKSSWGFGRKLLDENATLATATHHVGLGTHGDRVWHPRASGVDALVATSRGRVAVATRADADALGDLAAANVRELDAVATLGAHLGALMTFAWPAHYAARVKDREKALIATLGLDAEALRRVARDPAEALADAFDPLDPENDAFARVFPGFAEGVVVAKNAAPEVFAACMPSPDAPLRAAEAALGAKGEEPLAAAADHVDAADAVAARLGATRARLESLHAEEPETARAAMDAALGAARDPCAVAGTLAALHCGALKAGITRWGETMTGCAHALDVLASPKCAAGVVVDDDTDADEADLFPGSAANNAHGRAHNGVDARACVETVAAKALPCSRECGDAFVSVASACGGVVPRAGRWRHDGGHLAAACSAAVASAHASCASHRECQGVFEAMPRKDATFFATRPARVAAARRAAAARRGEFDASKVDVTPPADKLDWAEQHVWGVLPEETCHDDRLELDARGNNLQGKPPSCAWESAKAGGAVLLSRNRLSGEMSPVGDVHTVHAGFNTLRGELGDVFGKAVANGLAKLVVNDNNFTSRDGLARLGGSKRLEILDVSSNALGPAGSATLAKDLASFPALTRYDVGGNDWDHAAIARSVVTDAPAKKRPEYVALHAQVTLPAASAPSDACGRCANFKNDVLAGDANPHIARVALRHCTHTNGCEHVAEDASGSGSGSAPSPPVLESVTCALRAALEPELVRRAARRLRDARDDATLVDANGPDKSVTFASVLRDMSAWDVKLLDGVVDGDDGALVLGYTLTPSANGGGDDDVVAEALHAALERLKRAPPSPLSFASKHCSGAHEHHGGAREDLIRAADAASAHLHAAHVDVRGGCAVGRMGENCDYVCATEWSRTATSPRRAGLLAGAALGRAAKTTMKTPAAVRSRSPSPNAIARRMRALATKINADASADDVYDDGASCSRLDASRGACVRGGGLDVIASHEFIGDATTTPRPRLAYALETCASDCRGRANLAVASCTHWLVDKARASLRDDCRVAVADMQRACGGASSSSSAAAASSYAPEACAGKAPNAFARLGEPLAPHASGCETCGIVHYLEAHGLSRDDHDAVDGSHAGGVFRATTRRDTWETDVGRRARAAMNRAEADARAAWGTLTPREDAATTIDAASLGAADAVVVDVDAAAGSRAPPSSRRSPMFPTCSAHLECSARCHAHVHSAVMRHCSAWIDGEGGDDARGACEDAIDAAPAACEARERATCVDSVAVGFRALLDAKPKPRDAKKTDADAEQKMTTKTTKKTTPPPLAELGGLAAAPGREKAARAAAAAAAGGFFAAVVVVAVVLAARRAPLGDDGAKTKEHTPLLRVEVDERARWGGVRSRYGAPGP